MQNDRNPSFSVWPVLSFIGAVIVIIVTGIGAAVNQLFVQYGWCVSHDAWCFLFSDLGLLALLFLGLFAGNSLIQRGRNQPAAEKILHVETEQKVAENPIRVKIHKQEKKVRHEIRYIPIEIHNDSPNKQIEGCKVQLVSVVNVKNKESVQYIQQYLLWNARHHAETQDGYLPLNILAGGDDYGLCDVVKEEGPTSVRYLTRLWDKRPMWVDTGEYILSLAISGNYDGFSVFKKYTCTMICDDQFEVELKDMREIKNVE